MAAGIVGNGNSHNCFLYCGYIKMSFNVIRLSKLFMHTLDWGHITPESFNFITNTYTHIYNHDLTSDEKVDRTIRFIIGRLNYYDSHLPKGSAHSIKIDARGQQISDLVYDQIKQGVLGRYSRPNSLTIQIFKQ
jgi:hypothetical protein